MGKIRLYAILGLWSFIALNLGASVSAFGETDSSILQTIWATPNLYVGDDENSIQSFSLVGRYHGQYWSVSSEGATDDGWENRRMYVGINSRFFNSFTIEVQAAFNDKFDPVYEGLYDAYLKWEDSGSDFSASLGRLDFVYTGLERTTSSKKIVTLERAQLVNQLMPGEAVGLYLNGKRNEVGYQIGLFSGSIEDEFTSFEGGYAALAGFDLAFPLFYEKGTLHLDYLYNNGNVDNNAFEPYEHIISFWHKGSLGAFEFGMDLSYANGLDSVSDVLGLTLLPAFDLGHNIIMNGDKFQLAARYHYASSNDGSDLQFNKRYEQEVANGKGGQYNSLYLGLNYYIYQQKLKLMAGIEYFTMQNVMEEDYESGQSVIVGSVDGWSFITGVRLYF